MPARTCTNCDKPESELPNTLKVCAKCHTQAYCSRDCQKAHWKIHKRECGRVPSAPVPGSLDNPPKEEILSGARETIDLMKALAKCEGFNHVLRDMRPEVANLMYLSDFVQKTFREYWFNILPQRDATDLMLSCAEFFGKNEEEERRALAAKLMTLEKDDPEVFRGLAEWPEKLDTETYSDGLTRNLTAAQIVMEPRMQKSMGGTYKYPEEVKALAKKMLTENPDQEVAQLGDVD